MYMLVIRYRRKRNKRIADIAIFIMIIPPQRECFLVRDSSDALAGEGTSVESDA